MNDWDYFLNWLSSDPDLGASEYKVLRQKLIAYFIKRGCADPEGCADQTVERVVQLLPRFGGDLPAPPVRFCYGVAKFIHKEYLREQSHIEEPVADDYRDPRDPSIDEEKEVTDRCLHRCLANLDAHRRETFRLYYLVEPQTKVDIRHRLAERQGITINALRLQMLRLKEELRSCIANCRSMGAGFKNS